MLKSEQILDDRYQLQEKLGERPNRQTWLAIDLEAKEETKQQVVIKLLAFGGQMQWQDLKLFEREAQILREVKHPCIPKYYDYFSIDDRILWFALVEEYMPGSSLQNLLNQGKRFTEQEVKNIALELLSILNFLHQLKPQILHRDIKPSNIILGEDKQVYLIDFGAVQDKAAVEGASFTVVGTYGYTPMEQFGGKAVPASDLYALGATLIHVLTGISPSNLHQKDLQIQFKNCVSISDHFADWLTKITYPAVEKRINSTVNALELLQSSRPIMIERFDFDPYLKSGNTRIKLLETSKEIEITIPACNLLAIATNIVFWVIMASIKILVIVLFLILLGVCITVFLCCLLPAFVVMFEGGLNIIIGLTLLATSVVASLSALLMINLIKEKFSSFFQVFSQSGYVNIIYMSKISNRVIIGSRILNFFHKISEFDIADIKHRFFTSKTRIGEDANRMLIVKLPNKNRLEFAKNLTQAECDWLKSTIRDWL